MQESTLKGFYDFNEFDDKIKLILSKGIQNSYAFCYFDVLNFKFINEECGYDFGDTILKKLDTMFAEIMRENECYSHVNGDIFLLFCKEDRIEMRLHSMEQRFNEIPEIQKNHVQIQFKVGAFIVTEQNYKTVPVMDMLKHATMAQQSIKQEDSVNFFVYTQQLQEQYLFEKQLMEDSANAFNNNEFKIYLQSVYDLKNNFKVDGARVEVIWQHPKFGNLTAEKFMPIFEKKMCTMEIDLYVMQEVCRYLSQLRQAGLPLFPICIGITKSTFMQEKLTERLIAIKQAFRIPDDIIIIEQIKSDFNKKIEESYRRKIVNYKNLENNGFKFVLNDFGSNFCDISTNKPFTANYLNIDISVFSTNFEHTKNKIVISNIIQMAHVLQIKVLAYNVNTFEEIALLKAYNCDLVLSDILSEPVPINNFTTVTNDEIYKKIEEHYNDVGIKKIEQNIIVPEEKAPCGIIKCKFDSAYTMMYINPYMQDMIGYSSVDIKEIFNNKFYKLIKFEENNIDAIEEELQEGKIVKTQLKIKHEKDNFIIAKCNMCIDEDDNLLIYLM